MCVSTSRKYFKSIETNGLIININDSKGVMIKGYDDFDKNDIIQKMGRAGRRNKDTSGHVIFINKGDLTTDIINEKGLVATSADSGKNRLVNC